MGRALQWTVIAMLAAAILFVATYGLLQVTAPGPRAAPVWTLGSPIPEPRGELATAVAHAGPCPEPPCYELERLFVMGGLAGLARTVDEVVSLGRGDMQWREEPPLPSPRHHPAAAGLDGAVHFTGGTADLSQPWDPGTNHWRLEVDGAGWEELESMPEGRWGHRLVEHDGRLYVIGGMGPTSRVLIYHPERGWETGAEMPAPRDHLSVVVLNGRIWAIGGRAPESLTRVDVYDPEADVWEPGPDLPRPTSGAAEGVVSGRILVLGGEEPAVGGGIIDRHWVLDPRPADPRWVPAPAPPLAVHGADGAVFQGTMGIVGGATRHGLLSVTAWTDAFQWLEPGVFPDLSSAPGQEAPGSPSHPREVRPDPDDPVPEHPRPLGQRAGL